jgi:large repetitive protein
MTQKFSFKKRLWQFCLACLGLNASWAFAQVQPSFGSCNASLYLMQAPTGSGPTTLYNIGTGTNPFTFSAIGAAVPPAYNGIGFNPNDNYIYGIVNGVTPNQLARIGADGSIAQLGSITGLPNGNYPAGEVAPDGTLYLKSNNSSVLYAINVTTRIATAVTLSTNVAGSLDLAWVNGGLYTVDNTRTLRAINPSTGAVTTIGTSGLTSGSFGAMWGTPNAVYGNDNAGSGFYQFDLNNGTATRISNSPGAANNDGAHCVTAPLTFGADIGVSKTDSSATYTPGTDVTYTITVSNSGPFGAAGVLVNDPLPAGISSATWTCAGVSGGACGAANGVGAINDTTNLPNGASVTYTLTLEVPASFTGNLANTVTVTPPATASDSNPGNNTATDTNTAAAQADLGISQILTTGNPTPAGTPVEYRIVVTNDGPSDVINALISDTVPSQLTNVTWSCSASGDANCGTASGTGNVSLNGNIESGAGNELVIIVRGTAPGNGTISANTATVTAPASTTDPDTSNNSATAPPVAVGPGVLELDKTATLADGNSNSVLGDAGDVINYVFAVENIGTVTVTNLSITDAQLDSPAVCAVASLAPNASTTCTGSYTITASDVDVGVVNNTATANATGPGGLPISSPADSTSTPLVQSPGISVTLTPTLTTDNGTPGVANIGDIITYNVTATNTGNVTLEDLVLTDILENGTPRTLSCSPTTLAPGETATCQSYTYVVTETDVINGGSLDNEVTATAQSSGSGATTVTAAAVGAVEVDDTPSQIRVTKTATPQTAKIGDLVRYVVTIENLGPNPINDAVLLDTPPAGFSFVAESLVVEDNDERANIAGSFPLRVTDVDIDSEGRAVISYLLRVGAGVRPGNYVNRAIVNGTGAVSNVATAQVRLVGDPLLDESLIMGTVWDDRDGDGWQDSAMLDDIRVQGGFAADAYVANSTTVDRGSGPAVAADASAPLLRGLKLGSLAGRESEATALDAQRIVISQKLTRADMTDDFVLTTAQGITLRLDAAGQSRVEYSKQAVDSGLSAAHVNVERRISQIATGYQLDYIITNTGITERGIPGVRTASVEGLLVETDSHGRYHLVGIKSGGLDRGRNFILKVDPVTLPPGSEFTTDNPLVRRITPGLPVRFDFGVKLPSGRIPGGESRFEITVGQLLFAPGSSDFAADYETQLDKIVQHIRLHPNSEIVINADGETAALALERAKTVQQAVQSKLAPEVPKELQVSLRTEVNEPKTTVVSLGGTTTFGTVLFDTDKAQIKPQFLPIIEKVAADIEQLKGGVIAVVGHTDSRGSVQYNIALGLRRAKAVFDAVAAKLTPAARDKLRVEISSNPTAPVDGPSQQ